MRRIVFDIETKNWFDESGSQKPVSLDLALVGVYDSAADSYESFLEEELDRLWPLLEHADVLVGFNSEHFDIPILNKYYPGDLTTIKSIDLMKEAQAVLGRRLSLDNLAQNTLGRGKIAHGLDATKWWAQGEIDKIREYCIDDVRLTNELFGYALTHGHWKYRDRDGVRELAIDTSTWQEGGYSVTHTLRF